jgi:hypothetical protein
MPKSLGEFGIHRNRFAAGFRRGCRCVAANSSGSLKSRSSRNQYPATARRGVRRSATRSIHRPAPLCAQASADD